VETRHQWLILGAVSSAFSNGRERNDWSYILLQRCNLTWTSGDWTLMDETVVGKLSRERVCCRWAEVASLSIHTPGRGEPQRCLQNYSLFCSNIRYAMINHDRANLVAVSTPMELSLLHCPVTVRPFCTIPQPWSCGLVTIVSPLNWSLDK
jgi:hypothetical protein